MKAVQINTYGSNEVVKLIEIDIPKLNDDEILVKVKTAGVNPIDWKIRNGMGKRLGLELPILLGSEIAGTVETVGKAVIHFKNGDSVYGMVPVGGFAEYVAVKVSCVALKPDAIDFEQAAAIPLCGLTAWQAIFDSANLIRGQKILITGASGAVGSLAVQFAKEKGAYVIALASGKNEAFVKSLGAEEFINYEKQTFEIMARGMDVVLDTVGGETFEKCHQTLKSGGTLVTSVSFPTEELALKSGIKAKRVFCVPNAEELSQISELVRRGKLSARVSKVFPIEDVTEALALSESGKANGKIVLKIAP